MHKHRVVSLAVSLLFTLGIIFSQGAFVKAAEVTSNSPSMKDISVNKTEAKAGDILTITLEASAEVSALSSQANLCYTTGIGESQVEKELTLHLNGNKYIGNIKIDENDQAGIWRPSFVVLKDKGNNTTITYNSNVHKTLSKKFASLFDMSKGNFNVLEQVTVPIFKSVSVNHNNVEMNDKVKLTIDTMDDFSGLSKEAYACYMMRTEKGVVEKEITLSLNRNKYESDITVDSSFIPGKWQLSFLILRSNKGIAQVVYNTQVHKNLGEDLSAADINVGEDIFGPKLNSISLKKIKEDIKNKVQTYEIRMKAEDDKELSDKAYISYISKGRTMISEKYIDLTLINDEYVGTFEIKSSESEGIWELSFIVLKDNEGNVTVIYNSDVHQVAGQKFTHMAIDEDFKAPELEDIEVIGSEINDNYKVIVTPSKDVSGLSAEANVCFMAVTTEGEAKLELPLKLVDGKYEGVARFDDKYQNVLWKVSFVVLEDSLGNANVVYNSDVHKIGRDLCGANVHIEGDNTSPVLEYVKLEGKASGLYDNVELLVKAIDNGNGLSEEAYVVYTSNEGKEIVEKQLTLKLEGGIYRKTINIDENFAAGNWKISFIVLQDEGGNIGITYNSAVHEGIGTDLSTADIAMEGDNAAPTIKKIMVNADEFKLYDKAEVTVVAEDSGAGLAEEASLCYTTEFGREKYLTLKLEEGVYKTSFTIDESFDGLLSSETWMISFITLQDKEGNARIVYNKDIHGSFGYDLSDGDMKIKQDISGPEFNGISVNANSYNLYDKAVITLRASDLGSGLGDEANVVYVTESGETKAITLKHEKGSYYGTYVGSVVVDESFKGVSWKVDFVTFEDANNNVSIVYNNEVHGKLGEELSNGNININHDIAAPELKKITMNEDSFKLYDKAIITVEAEESGSGLSDEASICYVTENGDEKFITLGLQDGKYVGSISIDESYKGVSWKVDFVTLEDVEGNVRVDYNEEIHGAIGQDLSDGNINIIEDVLGPKLIEIGISDREFDTTGDYIFAVKAEDNNGLSEKAFASFISEDSDEFNVELTLVGNSYTARINSEKDLLNKSWKLSFITLEDKDDNVTIVYNSDIHKELGEDLSNCDINIEKDYSGPAVRNIQLSANDFDLYDEIEIRLLAEDISGLVDEANVMYISESGKVKEMTLLLGEDGTYSTTFNVDEDFASEPWRISFIVLEDKQGNVSITYNSNVHSGLGTDLSAGDLKAKNDISLPVFEGMSISTDLVNQYENLVQIKVEASDDTGLAEKAQICYVSDVNGKIVEKEAELILDDNGNYVGDIRFDEKDFNGVWRISFLVLHDTQGNVRIVYNSNVHEGLGINLSDYNVIADNPKAHIDIQSVSVSQRSIVIDESVEIRVVPVKGEAELKETASVCYVLRDKDIFAERFLELQLVDGVYVGTIEAKEIADLGQWSISYITIEDVEENVFAAYNNDVHSIGINLTSGDFKIEGDIRGELIKDVNGFRNSIDAIVEFKIINYMQTDQEITLVFEVIDNDSNIVNKVQSRKIIRSSEGTIIKARMFVPEEGMFVRACLLDSEGKEIRTIIDESVIK